MKFYLRAIILSSLLLCLAFVPGTLLLAQTSTISWSVEFDGEKSFIENKGQFDGRNLLPGSHILYAVDNGEMQVYFTKQGVTYRMDKKEKNPNRRKGDRSKPKLVRTSQVVHITWENISPKAELVADGITQDYHVYSFLTADKSSAYTFDNVRGYKRLVYKNLYPGIDIEYVFHHDIGLKYSVILHPGADPSMVRMKYSDSTSFSLERTGNIIIPTILGDIIEHAPVTFYAGTPVRPRTAFHTLNVSDFNAI